MPAPFAFSSASPGQSLLTQFFLSLISSHPPFSSSAPFPPLRFLLLLLSDRLSAGTSYGVRQKFSQTVIKLEAGSAQPIPVELRLNEDASYSIQYTLSEQGNFSVSALVNDQHIYG